MDHSFYNPSQESHPVVLTLFQQGHFGGVMKMLKTYIATIFLGCIQILFAQDSTIENSSKKTTLESSSHKPNNENNLCRRLETLYTAYTNGIKNAHTNYLIPKKLHFIWLEDKLPKRCKKMIQLWKRFHPTWDVKVWRKQDAKKFNFINKNAFDRAKSLEEKSNIWRYEILYQFGGLYVDPRIKCHNSFDELNQTAEFYAFVDNQEGNCKLWNAIIGSEPHHQIISTCVFLITPGNGDQNSCRIDNSSGSKYFSNCVNRKAMNFFGKIAPIPMDINYNQSPMN